MAILTIKEGRGRPLSIDTNKLLSTMERLIPAARQRLSSIRKTTSGEQRETLLGSETSLPDSVISALDVIKMVDKGAKINKQTALMVKKSVKMVEQLASKQRRVFGRALSESLKEAYEGDIDYLENRGLASAVTRHYLGELKSIVAEMTPYQRQSFLLSRGYQSPKTAVGQYQRVIAWGENDYKEKFGESINFSQPEAWAYLLYRRAEDALYN